MKIHKLVLAMLSTFILAACSSTGIDATNPEQTARSLQSILGVEGEVEPYLEEWGSGIRKTYSIDEQSVFFLDKEEEMIEQINLRSLTKDEVLQVLDDLEFPDAYSFEYMLEYTNEELENITSSMTTQSFTNYQGIGINLKINDPEDHFVQSFEIDKPYGMNIVFNEERFEVFE